MFRCEKARRVLLVDKAKLNMAALLVLAVLSVLIGMFPGSLIELLTKVGELLM